MRTLAAFFGLVCIGLTGADVFASTVGVSPVRLQIARSGANVDLQLSNDGTEATAFNVRGFAWRQTPAGTIDLKPTSDLVVYPQRLVLAPHESRSIRVGFPGPLTATEREYRIVATETMSLPDDASASAPPSGTTLRIRSRLSIPLFVGPIAATTTVAASEASVDANGYTFSLSATGTAHLVATTVNVRAVDDAGETVATAGLPAWYLLPNQPRVYTQKLAAGLCARVKTLAIDATFESAKPLHAELVAKRACSHE